MKTKDHRILSYYLMAQFDYPVKKSLKHALILGSVEPDYNPFTYLHGSLKTEKFRGHNFDNARKCIVSLIHKIETEEMSELKRCYLLVIYNCLCYIQSTGNGSKCIAFWSSYTCNKCFRGGVLVGV